MRTRLAQSISVDQAARAAGLSRRLFERRFREQIGRTPKSEMVRLRLTRVKELLLDTDLPLIDIAEKAGFKHAEYLHAIFKLKTGKTPGEFRRMSSHRDSCEKTSRQTVSCVCDSWWK